MAPEVNFVEDIAPGKIDWTLKVRVINLWPVFNPKNLDECMQLDMVLLDEKCGKIEATIKKHLLIKFGGYIDEGSTYVINKLLVAQNDPKYRKTDQKYKLFFMGMTRVCRISADEIPLNHFNFAEFSKILTEMKQDAYCDVIGHIVEKDMLKNIEKNGRNMLLMDIVLEDLQKKRLTCTLWGEHAERVHTYISNVGQSGPVPVILQLVRCNRYQGVMAVSSAFYGTKIILDDDQLPEITDYKNRMVGEVQSMSQGVTQMVIPPTLSLSDEMLQTPRMTIGDLLEASETGFGAVYAKVIEIELDQGWLYDSCKTCLRRVTPVGTKYACDYCETLVAATPRFKIQLQVIDQTGSTTFTLFNTIVSMYVGRGTVDLIQSIKQQLANSPASPDEFKAFIGKQFLFKVEISEGNILKGWQSFTVKKITHDAAIIEQFLLKHNLEVTTDEDDAPNGEGVNNGPINDSIECADDIKLTNTAIIALPALDDTTTAAIVEVTGTEGNISVNATDTESQWSPSSVLDLNYTENAMTPIVEISDSETTPPAVVNITDSETTPMNKSSGKRSSSSIEAIEFPDLDLVSPRGGKVSKTIPDFASPSTIDFTNLDFSSPPTSKIPDVVVKIEKN